MLKQLLGVLRHALTAVGGGLVTNGSLSGDELTASVGAIITLIGIVFSVIDKQKSHN